MFTEYGRLALEGPDETPFQKLQFLVRDWQYAGEKPYGKDGGGLLLENKLKTQGQKQEMYDIRKQIKSSFSDICCFLLPPPGEAVAEHATFNGKLKGNEQHFNEK